MICYAVHFIFVKIEFQKCRIKRHKSLFKVACMLYFDKGGIVVFAYTSVRQNKKDYQSWTQVSNSKLGVLANRARDQQEQWTHMSYNFDGKRTKIQTVHKNFGFPFFENCWNDISIKNVLKLAVFSELLNDVLFLNSIFERRKLI